MTSPLTARRACFMAAPVQRRLRLEVLDAHKKGAGSTKNGRDVGLHCRRLRMRSSIMLIRLVHCATVERSSAWHQGVWRSASQGRRHHLSPGRLDLARGHQHGPWQGLHALLNHRWHRHLRQEEGPASGELEKKLALACLLLATCIYPPAFHTSTSHESKTEYAHSMCSVGGAA